MKCRKVYYHIEKALNIDGYSVIILMGLRKTGKTTVLQQLAQNHNGYYVDFRNSKDPVQDYCDIYNRKEKLILLDEIGYIPDFDAFFGSLNVAIKNAGKKVVITSSSYGTLKQIGSEGLGGGRSHKVEIFPLDFEEYLFFSGKISNYGNDYNPTVEDLQNFYRMKSLPNDMDFVIDKGYMVDTFTDVEVAHANYQYVVRDIELTREQYTSVIDILAYTLNEHISIKRFRGAQVGVQELAEKVRGLSLSDTLIGYANKVVNKMDVRDIATIIAFLIHNGFLFIDLYFNEKERQISDSVIHELLSVETISDFRAVLKKYTFSVISPLLYTRLMVNLEDVTEIICSNPDLMGKLYELTVKSEAVYQKGYDIYHDSHKYSNRLIEVDLSIYDLLLEAATGHKSNKSHSVDKIFVEADLIRVLTDEPERFEDTGIYYRIGYPKALFMLSNRSIYNLKKRKGVNYP